MRLEEPRIPPLSRDELSMAMPRDLGTGEVLNIFATLARYPELTQAWVPFGTHTLFANSLPPREREIVILRVGWLCQAGYEWGQHVVIGRREGVLEADFDRIREGPDAPGWSDRERALLRAVDELHGDAFVRDETWAALSDLSQEQKMDLVFTVGQYVMVSMALNSFGVQLDEGIGGLESGGEG